MSSSRRIMVNDLSGSRQGICQVQPPTVDLLRCMLLAREGDRREGILLHQNKGWLQVSGSGHEALSALALHLRPGDYVFPHYRDRALMLARGVSLELLARDFLARANSSSGGRNLPGHFSCLKHNVVSMVSPTGSQCLPASGCAWGIQLLERKTLQIEQAEQPSLSLCLLGDAATRQGEFYEAYCFAVQERLPVVFVVEDNGYGISTPTARLLPFRLGILDGDRLVRVNGRDVDNVFDRGGQAIERARSGDGPVILWCDLDRMCSHTSSDDHRVYRSKEEIESMFAADPIQAFSDRLIERGQLTAQEWSRMQTEAKGTIDTLYSEIEKEPLPSSDRVTDHLFGPVHELTAPPFQPKDLLEGLSDSGGLTMVAAMNRVFQAGLESFPSMLMVGEDIEDPKGGVFRFTAGLSTRFPGRVVNSPLAEATIVGLGAGLALSGFRPVFEIQFIDFMATGFNQLVTQVATLRWRSNGEWKCPLVIYAPYGAYLPAGGMWHSQSNDGWWAHTPGLRVAVPSTPADVVGLFWAAFQDEDPSLILIPKHIFRVRMKAPRFDVIPFGRAAVRREGADVTLVTWGSCTELAEKAAEMMANQGVSIEVIDLRTLVPCDWPTIEASLRKTGRLVVVHEDNRTCGFGQAVIAEMTSRPDRFQLLFSPPQLVARLDVHVPFCPDLEYATLPDLERVLEAVRITLE